MPMKHLKPELQKNHLPASGLEKILNRLLEHPKAIVPETFGEYRAEDLRAQVELFLKAFYSDRAPNVDAFPPEVVWFNHLVKWDSDEELSQKQRKRFRQVTDKLALGSRLALESVVKRLNELLQKTQTLEEAGQFDVAQDVKYITMTLAMEGMRVLGRCDMLEHMHRVKERSRNADTKGASSLARKEQYYLKTRKFLLDNGYFRAFSSVEELAEHLEKDKDFIRLIAGLKTGKVSWFYPAADGRPDQLISDPFTYQIKTWGVEGGPYLGWSEFLTPHKGRG